MKQLVITLLIVALLFGCATQKKIVGKSSVAENKQAAKITAVNNTIASTDKVKLDKIGEFSYGTGYALSLDTNFSTETKIAYDLNTRVQSLGNQPSINAIKSMQELVNSLLTNNIAGKKLLEVKDNEIAQLQEQVIILNATKEKEVSKYITLADKTASAADQLESELSTYKGWFGLKAIFKGIITFSKSSMWFLIIGGILFLVLRLLSTVNPIASAIFSVFETVISWCISTIKVVFPKALAMAGNVSTTAYNEVKGILTVVVDNLQFVKDIEAKTGQPATLKEVFAGLDSKLDTAEKEVIATIKKELGY